MKVPLSWLRDWVEWPSELDAAALAQRLTLGGLEVESITPAAPQFDGVVVAKILDAQRHPQADKLQLCRVVTQADAAGGAQVLQIVCGAPNARAGLITALATVGAHLPGGAVIRAAKLRGVESAGMLCSARELGLSDAAEGIIELPDDAPLGQDLRRYLDLDDAVLEIGVTPNRGDAMSVLGIAREVSALIGAPLKAAAAAVATASAGANGTGGASVVGGASAAGGGAGRISVTLQPDAGAARFLACVVHGVDNTRATPLWMRERLRRAGSRSISPVVDITNYLMLDLGQPMHAYDLARLQGALSARRGRSGEHLTLLDGRDVELDEQVLVIADAAGPVGLAGLMGGARTAVSAQSRDIVLEVAWFSPGAIAGRGRRYGLITDAGQRFERGVDWCGQERALEHARNLLQRITGGVAGAVTTAEQRQQLPATPSVALRPGQLRRLLGIEVAGGDAERRLTALGMAVRRQQEGWVVQPPSWRFDIAIEADLIEEVARLGGLDAIGEHEAALPIVPRAPALDALDARVVLRTLAARGYQEIITYAFVDPSLQRLLFGDGPQIELANPIASDLAAMRSSLWPGLIGAARENLRRQQQRVRLFEIADCFSVDGDGGYREQRRLAGLALGARWPEQWGSAATPVDFFDLKADVAALLSLADAQAEIAWQPANAQCLHPGRSARILRAGEQIGLIGELHPSLLRALDLTEAPVLFELDYAAAFHAQLAQFREISRFPRIRRDISVTVPEQVTFASLHERVSVTAASLLKELRVFDIYQGKGVESGRRSLALGLILQDLNRTLTDEEADRMVQSVLDDLRKNLDARIRE